MKQANMIFEHRFDLFYKISDRCYRIYHWITKCIAWSIFLWHDYDFDYSSIIRVLHYKIQRNRKCLEKNDTFIGCGKICRKMRIAEKYLERMMDNNYCEKDMQWLEQTYGHPKIQTKKVTLSNGMVVHELTGFHGSKSITSSHQAYEDWYYMFYHKKSDVMWKSDWAAVLKILERNIQSWWD